MLIKTTDKFLKLSHKISPTMTLQGSKKPLIHCGILFNLSSSMQKRISYHVSSFSLQ